MKSKQRLCVFVFFILSAFGFCSAKLALIQRAQFAPPADADEIQFGRSVAIDNDTAVVGSMGHDSGNLDVEPSPATARVYRWTNGQWGLEATIAPADALSSTATPVSISQDDLVIGAEETSEVLVYHRQGSQWLHTARLTPPDLQYGDLFGISVAVRGDWIGVSSWNRWNQWEGRFYLFHRDEDAWSLRGIIRAGNDDCPAQSIYPRFGMTDTFLLPDGVWIVVAGEQPGPEGGMGVFMFSCGTDSQAGMRYQGQLVCPSAESGFEQDYGLSIAADEGNVMVGSPYTDLVHTFRGQESDSWGCAGTLSSREVAPTRHFGNSVDIDGDWAVVGGYRSTTEEPGGPAVYQRRDSWLRRGEQSVRGRPQPYGFGYTAAVSGRFIIVGSPHGDDQGAVRYRGEAFIFEVADCPSADLNVDCLVNLADLSILAHQWLE